MVAVRGVSIMSYIVSQEAQRAMKEAYVQPSGFGFAKRRWIFQAPDLQKDERVLLFG
jgi:hypothetical protein